MASRSAVGVASSVDALVVPLTVIAQDPSVKDSMDRVLLTTVDVPVENLQPGPTGHRLAVLDIDVAGEIADPPPRFGLDSLGTDAKSKGWRPIDRFAEKSGAELVTDRKFRAQNVFATAAAVLSRFERALGRRIPWSFGDHRLWLIPQAFQGANAFYSPDDHCIRFGYLPQGEVFTCLSHDVVAHEVTHAVLDGLRPRYLKPGLPDQPAFHEGFADIVALLHVLESEDVVARVLERNLQAMPNRDQRINATKLEATLLQGALFGLAEQLGTVLQERALRQSLSTVPQGATWREQPAFQSPHRRGEVIVAAVLNLVAGLWTERLRASADAEGMTLGRVAEDGSAIARHVLTMCIRGLDYVPTVEFEFEDFLTAMLLADELLVPNDTKSYRAQLRQSFAVYGVTERSDDGRVPTERKHPWRYHGVNAHLLANSRDEIYRFIWNNADNLGIDLRFHTSVDRVVASRRVGPDGVVVDEIIADYSQTFSTTLAELPDRYRSGVEKPPGDPEVQCWGGGVIAFDQFCRPVLHIQKSLTDDDRQRRRLERLVQDEIFDSRDRLGFSDGRNSSARFRALHLDDADFAERW